MCELFDPVELKQKLEQFYTYHNHIHALLPKNKDENQEQIARLGRAMTMFLKAKRTVDDKVKQLQLSNDGRCSVESNIIMQKREEISELIKDTHDLDSTDVTIKQLKENLLEVLKYLHDIFQQNADHKDLFQQLFDHLENSKSSQDLYLSEQNDLLHNGFTYMNDSIDTLKTGQKTVNDSLDTLKAKQNTLHEGIREGLQNNSNRLGKLEANHENIELYYAEQNESLDTLKAKQNTLHEGIREGLQDNSNRLGKLEANHENIELYYAEQNDILHQGFTKIGERFTHLDEKLVQSDETIAKGFMHTHEKLNETDERMQEGFKKITETTNSRADIDQAERIMYDQDNNTRLGAVLTVSTLSIPGVPISCTLFVGSVSLYYFGRSIYNRYVIDQARKSIQ
jgi:hypothetical protein